MVQAQEPKKDLEAILGEDEGEKGKNKEGKPEDWLTEYEGQLTVDVYQTSSDIVVKAPIAGVRPEDVDISITDDVLNIKGERKEEIKVSRENYYTQECYWGSFSRSIILPVPVITEKAHATFKNGILTITIPKSERIKTKNIRVKAL
jgi:HSP20 family protein